MSEIDTSRENVEEIADRWDAVGRPGIARMMRALLTRAEAAEDREAVLRGALAVTNAHLIECERALDVFHGLGNDAGSGSSTVVMDAKRALTSTAEAAAARDARIQRKAERDIVEDAMAMLYMAPRNDETTMDALRRLIEAEQAVALDPAVSAGARALIERGRRDGIEDAARVADEFGLDAASAIRALLDKPAGEDGR